MTISEISMTISLTNFAFAAFCGKCGLSTSMLNFIVVAKNTQIWYNSGAKLVRFHDFWPFPLSVGTLLLGRNDTSYRYVTIVSQVQ